MRISIVGALKNAEIQRNIKIKVIVTVDIAMKIEKIFRKTLDGVSNLVYIVIMPNQPDKNKRLLAVRISREFYRRLQKLAKEKRMGFNEFVRWLIWRETENIALTKEDYEIIEREKQITLRKNTKGRVQKN